MFFNFKNIVSTIFLLISEEFSRLYIRVKDLFKIPLILNFFWVRPDAIQHDFVLWF